ncbi:MAG: DUF2400 domain-containing protein [Planctomycetes bacterium]|nr:DUF2400 domain-containing protein [Planctomycetota bacterium]
MSRSSSPRRTRARLPCGSPCAGQPSSPPRTPDQRRRARHPRLPPRRLRAFEGEGDLLRGFRHRWIDGEDLHALFDGIRRTRDRHGSLEGLFRSGDEGSLGGALDAFQDALRGRSRRRGVRFLLPRPAEGSACKRPLLFLRWVARPDDGADLGLWSALDPARLLVPLDTHVYRIAYWLGLTDRKRPSWRTAEEVTAALRAFDPADPVRFDFRPRPPRHREGVSPATGGGTLRPLPPDPLVSRLGRYHSIPSSLPSDSAHCSASFVVSKVSPGTISLRAQRV